MYLFQAYATTCTILEKKKQNAAVKGGKASAMIIANRTSARYNKNRACALVMELVDVGDSKSPGSDAVPVRVRPGA